MVCIIKTIHHRAVSCITTQTVLEKVFATDHVTVGNVLISKSSAIGRGINVGAASTTNALTAYCAK